MVLPPSSKSAWRDSRRMLDRRLVAQQFLHRRFGDFGAAAQQLKRFGIAKQCQESARDEVGRRLMSADQA